MRSYSNGPYGLLTTKEQYTVNTEHRLVEDQAVSLPMTKKLARHFANNASDHAIEQLAHLIDKTKSSEFDYREKLQEIQE